MVSIHKDQTSGRYIVGDIDDKGFFRDGKIFKNIDGYEKILGWVLHLFNFAIKIEDKKGEVFYLNRKSAIRWARRQDVEVDDNIQEKELQKKIKSVAEGTFKSKKAEHQRQQPMLPQEDPNDGINWLSQLPLEIRKIVFNKISDVDLKAMICTCQSNKELLTSDAFIKSRMQFALEEHVLKEWEKMCNLPLHKIKPFDTQLFEITTAHLMKIYPDRVIKCLEKLREQYSQYSDKNLIKLNAVYVLGMFKAMIRCIELPQAREFLKKIFPVLQLHIGEIHSEFFERDKIYLELIKALAPIDPDEALKVVDEAKLFIFTKFDALGFVAAGFIKNDIEKAFAILAEITVTATHLKGMNKMLYACREVDPDLANTVIQRAQKKYSYQNFDLKILTQVYIKTKQFEKALEIIQKSSQLPEVRNPNRKYDNNSLYVTILLEKDLDNPVRDASNLDKILEYAHEIKDSAQQALFFIKIAKQFLERSPDHFIRILRDVATNDNHFPIVARSMTLKSPQKVIAEQITLLEETLLKPDLKDPTLIAIFDAFIELGDANRAFEIIDRIEKHESKIEALIQILEKVNNISKAPSLLQKIEDYYLETRNFYSTKTTVKFCCLMANLYYSINNQEKTKNFEILATAYLNPDKECVFFVANFYLKQGDVEKAINYVDKAMPVNNALHNNTMSDQQKKSFILIELSKNLIS